VITWSKEVNDYVIPPGFAFALAVVYVIYLLCYPSQQNRERLPLFSYRRDKSTLAAIYHIRSKSLLGGELWINSTPVLVHPERASRGIEPYCPGGRLRHGAGHLFIESVSHLHD
jgi:hypothetical protein